MKSIKAAKLKKMLRRRGLGTYRTKFIKRLRSETIDFYLYLLSIKAGDVVNDCDRFNHEIVGVAAKSCWKGSHRGPVLTIQFEREDGLWTCGCPWGPDKAWPRERILEFQRGYYLDEENVEQLKRQELWDEGSERIRMALLKGTPLIDDRGIPIR